MKSPRILACILGGFLFLVAVHFTVYPIGNAEATPQASASARSNDRKARRTSSEHLHSEETFSMQMSRILETLANEVPDQQQPDIQTLADSVEIARLPELLKLLSEKGFADVRRDLGLLLVSRWAAIDPARAAAWSQELPCGSFRSAVVDELAIVWATNDLKSVTEWIDHLAVEDRNPALTSVAYEASRANPLGALSIAAELPATSTRDDLVTHAVAQWASSDPKTAAEWGRKISDTPLRERVLSTIATSWGDTDPYSAAVYATQVLLPGRTKDDAVIGIVQRWVQKDPVEAESWVEQFPECPLRDTAMEYVANLWPR